MKESSPHGLPTEDLHAENDRNTVEDHASLTRENELMFEEALRRLIWTSDLDPEIYNELVAAHRMKEKRIREIQTFGLGSRRKLRTLGRNPRRLDEDDTGTDSDNLLPLCSRRVVKGADEGDLQREVAVHLLQRSQPKCIQVTCIVTESRFHPRQAPSILRCQAAMSNSSPPMALCGTWKSGCLALKRMKTLTDQTPYHMSRAH